jgi:dsRNA-specific ribonuclease
MANDGYLFGLQHNIGHMFTDVALLDLALRAPGAEGEKEGTEEEQKKYDGNRKLAQLGESVIQVFVLEKSLFEEGANRSRCASLSMSNPYSKLERQCKQCSEVRS